LSAAIAGPVSAGSDYTRVELLAAFLYRIGSYVEWTNDALPEEQSSLDLCVVGHDPLGISLTELEGEPLKDRVLHVRRLRAKDSLTGCHILFIGDHGKQGAQLIERASTRTGLLITSDRRAFACAGGTLQFYDQGNSISLKINLDAAKRADLQFSSNFLSLTKIKTDKSCKEIAQ
jgi:hypothetical protein